ncbi:MAG TPA: rhodanese-like domain-containing protein [Gaiellaceae bacterium]|nr:rhodanese-like domain-containing protein [Gaiellaceae bacterium]
MNAEIHPREAQALLEGGDAVALDVREPYEWHHGHIRDALHIPLGEIGRRLHELPPGKRIVAVCRSGNRSGAVIAPLRQLGYEVLNLSGGLLSWHASGLPLEPATGGVA